MNLIERLKELEARLAPEHEDVMLDRAHLRKLLAVVEAAKKYKHPDDVEEFWKLQDALAALEQP